MGRLEPKPATHTYIYIYNHFTYLTASRGFGSTVPGLWVPHPLSSVLCLSSPYHGTTHKGEAHQQAPVFNHEFLTVSGRSVHGIQP